MEKVKCPVCDNTLIFVDHILGEIKCQRCKNKLEDINHAMEIANARDEAIKVVIDME